MELNRENVNKYIKLTKEAKNIFNEIHDELLKKAVEVLNWKNEHLNTDYVLGTYRKSIKDITNNHVTIYVYETWAYGGEEDHYYSVRFDEIFSENWKEIALKEKAEKEKKQKKMQEEKKRKAQEEKDKAERALYEKLKEKYEK